MLKKKKGLAYGEIRGILVFLFVLVIGVFIFYGCNIININKSNEEVQVSTTEIEIIKDLNFFLEIQIDKDRKVSDIIIESYKKNDYDEFKKIASEYFLKKRYGDWKLILSDMDNNQLFNSRDYDTFSRKSPRLKIVAESETKIIFPSGTNNFEFINILFQIREYY